MGYCYYGNYVFYFEVGRVEVMCLFGMLYCEFEEQGVMFFVSYFEIDYYKLVLYDDELIIEIWISVCCGLWFFFDYMVFNEKGEQLCSVKIMLVFVVKMNMWFIMLLQEFIYLMLKYVIEEF